MKLHSFVFSPFSENTYIVEGENHAATIIDPGCYSESERNTIATLIKDQGLLVDKVVNTHCHIDHVFGNRFLTEKYGIPLYAPSKDLYNLERAKDFVTLYGLNYDESPAPDFDFGKTIELGGLIFDVLFTPGHCSGHVSFYNKENNALFSGDVVFKNSIGRTDLPGGDMKTLMETIKNEILILPNETKIFSGHGPVTTVGDERNTNPFIREYILEGKPI